MSVATEDPGKMNTDSDLSQRDADVQSVFIFAPIMVERDTGLQIYIYIKKHKMCLQNGQFLKNVTLIFDLTLTDNVDLRTKEKVISQGIDK